MTVRCAVRVALALAALISFRSVARAQDSGDQTPSLGDLARQTRAQHAAAEGQHSKAQELADQIQRAQEASDNAPTGFSTYDAGDYRLFVPFPYTEEGNDNGGPVLLGSRLGVTHTEVMAGTPVPIPPYVNENTLTSWVISIARRYSASSVCSPMQMGSHEAFRCVMNNASLLGHSATGSMELIVTATAVIPVLCVSPNEPMPACHSYDARGIAQPCNYVYQNRDDYQRYQNEISARQAEGKTSSRSCEQIVLPSIELKEDSILPPQKMAEDKAKASTKTVSQDTSVAAGAQNISPADLARQTRQAAARTKVSDGADSTSTAPAGFQTFTLQYCINPKQCSEASLVIPERTEVVSHVNGQYIFKVAIDGDYALFYAGPADVNEPYRSLTDADWVRVRDLANVNGWAHGKPDAVTTQQTNVENWNAVMSHVRYQRDQKRWWVGERIVIARPNGQFLLGCTAPEDRFDKAEAMFTTLVKSLRLP